MSNRNGENGLIHKAQEALAEAHRELKRAKRTGRSILVQDACGKAWLAITAANEALFAHKGVPIDKFPRNHRGTRHLLSRFGSKSLRQEFEKLYLIFHVAGYYGRVDFPADTIAPFFKDLDQYVDTMRKQIRSQ